MGLTRRKDSYYVEFFVVDDGKALKLVRGGEGGWLKRWKVGGLNKTVAKEQEALIKTELMKGLVKSDKAPKPLTFGVWGEQYLALETVKSLRSYQDREEIMRRQLIPFFGGMLLSEITPEDVERFRAQRTKRNGKAASPQTINNDHIVLKHCLNEAIKRRVLSGINPATLIKMPNPNNERDRVLTQEEWGKLYDAAKPHLKPVLLVAYHSGQRFGEIVGLTWDRVDLRRGFITLRGVDTKTKKPRQVPMTPPVRETLTRLSKVRQLHGKHVFLWRGGPIKRVTRTFRTALTEAGISNFRFHDLRHCAATNLRRAGVDTLLAMKIVGHTSEKSWRRYNTIAESELLGAANKLSTYLATNTLITPADAGAVS